MLQSIQTLLIIFGFVFISELCAETIGNIAVTGELKTWHKVTVTMDGPLAGEMDSQPNPFTDFRCTAKFSHESGALAYTVPGYFAGDGNAAESGTDRGTKWRVHFSPDRPGKWKVEITLVSGDHLPKGESRQLDLSGASGTFSLAWFNPREGGELISSQQINGGKAIDLKSPTKDDWLAVIRVAKD